MAEIQSIAFSQNQSLSISKSVSASYERSERASVASIVAGNQKGVSQDDFGRVFDVLDISEDARQQLLEDRANAERFAAIVRGDRPQVLRNPLVVDGGQIRIDAAAAEAVERFSFTETYELSFLQESTLEIETDEGSISITQSRLVEVELASSIELERSISAGAFQASFSA